MTKIKKIFTAAELVYIMSLWAAAQASQRREAKMINKNRELLKHPAGSIYSEGYGQIAKKIMRDSRLNVEAKSIYAYICSFAGAGDTAFPSIRQLKLDLRIGANMYYRCIKQLCDCKYIRAYKQFNINTNKYQNVYEILYKQ